MLLTLLIKGFTLPGSYEGIKFFFTPQWHELLTVKVWFSALTQLFFSLSVGVGAVINYSSYNPFNHDIYRDGLILSCTDTITSVLAGVTIFSILGNLASELGVPVRKVHQFFIQILFCSIKKMILYVYVIISSLHLTSYF